MNRESLIRAILDMSCQLIRNQAISVGPSLNLPAIRTSFEAVHSALTEYNLNVISYPSGDYPALYCDAGKPGDPPVGDLLIAGHYDVVPPQNQSQMTPVIDGDWLIGRGAADMLTVVSTLIIFFQQLAKSDLTKIPRIGLLLVGNEESGEMEEWGTPYVLKNLKERFNYVPKILVAGERTGEGDKLMGLFETRNRGLIRIHCEASGEAGHTAMLTKEPALFRMLKFIRQIEGVVKPSDESWKSVLQVSYFHAGEPENFNTSATRAVAGIEIRAIPEDDSEAMMSAIQASGQELGISLELLNHEPGVTADPKSEEVLRMVRAAADIAGVDPKTLMGTGKLPGTQARFAPKGCHAMVWGQAGVGPHSKNEAHYIPSIWPFYEVPLKLAE